MIVNIEKKLEELNNQKKELEGQAAQLQGTMASVQQKLAQVNRGYLLILGEIKAYEEMKEGK